MQRPFKIALYLSLLTLITLVLGGVRGEIEDHYEREYENRALFLKVPVRGQRQFIAVRSTGAGLDTSNQSQPLMFKVGDQVRILDVSFENSSVEFEISSIDQTVESKLIFQFPVALTQDFRQRDAFERALEQTFTAGRSYRDLDQAREQFISGRFDDLIQQIATATGTTSEHVIETISEENPRYKEAMQRANEAEGRAAQLTRELEEERQSLRNLQSRVNRLTDEVQSVRAELNSLDEERQQLQQQNQELERRIQSTQREKTALENRIEQLDTEINNIAGQLNIESEGRSQLDQQVKSLGQSISSLQSERQSLNQKLGQVGDELEKLQNDKAALTAELEKEQSHRIRLQSDLAALTSNRDSLEANFLKLRREKQGLESARRLEGNLRLQAVEPENGSTEEIQQFQVFLAEHAIGVLQVQPAETLEEAFKASFRLLSPDTVKFSDEIKALYETLGDQVRVGIRLSSESPLLRVETDDAKTLQSVEPRGQVSWSWQLSGEIEEPERISFVLYFNDVNDHLVSVANRDYLIAPAGLWSGFLHAFSWSSLLVGFLIGLGIMSVVVALRNSSRAPPQGASVRRSGEKQL